MPRVSNEEWAHWACLQWAASKAQDGQGALGYPSTTVEGRAAKGDVVQGDRRPATSKVPNCNGMGMAAGKAVSQLCMSNQKALKALYLGEGQPGERIKRVCKELRITKVEFQGFVKSALLEVYERLPK